MSMNQENAASIGLIGLGTMGAALALNIAEKGFPIAVFNRTLEKTHAFMHEAGDLAERITPCDSLASFVKAIKPPRSIILMLTAGSVIDEQMAALRPLLDKQDLIIDCGNANFRDTNRRAAAALAADVPFLGVGVSGGEEGARHGPSIMAGGPKDAYDRVAPVFKAIAARYQGIACADWMGEAGAGHFVKSVHNGIEYADMQMISEVYGILRDGFRMPAAEISKVFARWNEGTLKSYLVEISSKVSAAIDPATGLPVLDIILDRAGQKGTGRWTVIEAQHVSAPVGVIEAAVAARNLSARLAERTIGAGLIPAPDQPLQGVTIDMLEQALIAGKIICYAQGFNLITAAGAYQGWTLPLPEIARVWREGCIIRSDMLNDMADALTEDPSRNLLFSEFFLTRVNAATPALRLVVASAALAGVAMPALSAALSYLDTIRTVRTSANMIQAQRDFFGAHSFERVDAPGAHHGPWGLHG